MTDRRENLTRAAKNVNSRKMQSKARSWDLEASPRWDDTSHLNIPRRWLERSEVGRKRVSCILWPHTVWTQAIS